MSGQPERLPALDALRAIGALMVVAVHVGVHTGASIYGFKGAVIARLDSGVAIFFVLSGFLLFRPFALARAVGSRSPSVARYLTRRALRILPAYWLTVVVVLLVLPQNRGTSGRLWFEYLTLTFTYDPYFYRAGLIQTWSLCTEASFYLVLPVLAAVALGRRWRPRLTLAILVATGIGTTGTWLVMRAVAFAPAVQIDSPIWLPTHMAWFCGGMALAAVHVALATGTAPRSWNLLDRVAAAPLACWAVAAGLLCLAATPLTGPVDLSPFTVTEFGTRLALEGTIAALALIPLAFGGGNAIKRAFGSAPARWLGTVSYGLFLWHTFVLEMIYVVMGWHLGDGGFPEVYLVTVGLTLVLAAASWYVLERPLLSLGARRPTRQPAPASEAPAVAQ